MDNYDKLMEEVRTLSGFEVDGTTYENNSGNAHLYIPKGKLLVKISPETYKQFS